MTQSPLYIQVRAENVFNHLSSRVRCLLEDCGFTTTDVTECGDIYSTIEAQGPVGIEDDTTEEDFAREIIEAVGDICGHELALVTVSYPGSEYSSVDGIVAGAVFDRAGRENIVTTLTVDVYSERTGDTAPNVAHALRRLAERIEEGRFVPEHGESATVLDVNGNTVGRCSVATERH